MAKDLFNKINEYANKNLKVVDVDKDGNKTFEASPLNVLEFMIKNVDTKQLQKGLKDINGKFTKPKKPLLTIKQIEKPK